MKLMVLIFDSSCIIPQGLHLQSLFFSLPDLDECATGSHGCENECVNVIGSYQCRCPRGQFLDEEGRMCSSEYSH